MVPIDFGSRLEAAILERGNLCIGIDPHPTLLSNWGLDTTAQGLSEFSQRCVESFGDLAAAIKPQVALFEEYGSAGITVLERVLDHIAQAGALSIADAKRGDIGSTMAAYARAWLGPDAPLRCDALTVSPYLGTGALEPAFELAASNNRGLFVLARTSNPEATPLQSAQGKHGSVAQQIVHEVAARNAQFSSTHRASSAHNTSDTHSAKSGSLGPFGVVIGATVTDPPDLSSFGGPILMPGVGEQGGTRDDVLRIAGAAKRVTLVNVSRQLLSAGPAAGALRAAASRLVSDFRL